MAYATVQDMIDRFTEAEVRALGVTVDAVTIPERPFIGLSTDDAGMVVEIAQDAMSRALSLPRTGATS